MEEKFNANLERHLPDALRKAVQEHPWKKLLQAEEARIRQSAGRDDAPAPGIGSGSAKKTSFGRRAAAVAAVLLVVVVAGYFVRERFFTEPPALAISMMILPDASPTAGLTAEENFRIGREAFTKKEYKRAIEHFRQVPESVSYYYDAQFFMAHAYHQLGEYNKAIPIYEDFLKDENALLGRINGANQREDNLRWNLVIACWGSGQLQRTRAELKILKNLPDISDQVKEKISQLEKQL